MADGKEKKERRKKSRKPAAAAEGGQQSSSSAPRRRKAGVEFLPCPGLSSEDLKASLADNAEYWKQEGQRPKENVKYSFEDKQQIDYVREIFAKNVWYYKDRMMVARGPCNLPVLRQCWVHGVIDENTLVWGQGLMDWLPAKNIRTLVPMIRTVEVQVATWIKRTFALKPALARMRKMQGRKAVTSQVDEMY